MYTEEDREALIEYGMIHFSDLIPYDDPNYEERLRQMAESYAESEINPDPEFIEMCRQHDEMLEAGLLDEEFVVDEELPF